MVRWISLMSLLLAGCPQSTTTNGPGCALDLVLDPGTAAVGEVVRAVGGPVTDVWDTSVRVGGVDASVLSVDRTGCDACDLCRQAAGCDGCGLCTDCTATCDSCQESVSFEVPAVVDGPADVVVVNPYGRAEALALDVTSVVNPG